MFRVVLLFCMGSGFYTKNDIMAALGVPVYGMAFGGRGSRRNGESPLLRRQDELLAEGICTLKERYGKVYLLDASDGRDIEAFLQACLHGGKAADMSGFERYTPAQYGIEAALVVVVPFAVHCREKITDEINNAKLHNAKIEGAVLAGVDVCWARLYYGK